MSWCVSFLISEAGSTKPENFLNISNICVLCYQINKRKKRGGGERKKKFSWIKSVSLSGNEGQEQKYLPPPSPPLLFPPQTRRQNSFIWRLAVKRERGVYKRSCPVHSGEMQPGSPSAAAGGAAASRCLYGCLCRHGSAGRAALSRGFETRLPFPPCPLPADTEPSDS